MKKFLYLLSFLLLCQANFAHAAIALDNNTTAVQVRNATTTPYFTATVNSNTNGILLLLLSNTGSAVDHLTNCTDNGTTMTVDVNVGYSTSGTPIRNYIIHLLNPPTGNNVIQCPQSTSGSFGGSLFSYTGVKQSDTLDSTANNSVTSGTTVNTTNTVVAANSWIVGFYQSSTNCTFQASTVITQHTPNSGQSACEPAGDSNGVVATGSITPTFSGTTDSGLETTVSLAPAPASGASHAFYFLKVGAAILRRGLKVIQ